MPRYRKKPVVIDAIRCRDAIAAFKSDRWEGAPAWLREAHEHPEKTGGLVFLPKGIAITTLEGTMTALLDDWIIRGVKGELYPCKPDIFEQLYDPVKETP